MATRLKQSVEELEEDDVCKSSECN